MIDYEIYDAPTGRVLLLFTFSRLILRVATFKKKSASAAASKSEPTVASHALRLRSQLWVPAIVAGPREVLEAQWLRMHLFPINVSCRFQIHMDTNTISNANRGRQTQARLHVRLHASQETNDTRTHVPMHGPHACSENTCM